ncbi:MAG: hypothetical protein RLZZ127_2019 [Planctomycetota bacterium]|jgi:hypothetical protein
MSLPEPGPAHPEPPAPAEVLARRLRVPLSTLQGWIDAGLPCHGGVIDPFAALTWASWAGDQAPVVQARWRRYVAWMLHPAARRPRRLLVRRVHRAFLPGATAGTWWAPPLAVDACQETAAEPWRPEAVADLRRPLVREHPVRLRPRPAAADPWLLAQVRTVAGSFRYGYRHHRPGEQAEPGPRSGGTCIDAVLALAALLRDGGRPWRIVAGVTASDAYANPHWWIESGDAVLDPTVPAIARMAGLDWEAAVAAACAGRDNRRIAFAPPPRELAATTLGGLAGAVLADGADAFAATDWACGRCGWRFAAATARALDQ